MAAFTALEAWISKRRWPSAGSVILGLPFPLRRFLPVNGLQIGKDLSRRNSWLGLGVTLQICCRESALGRCKHFLPANLTQTMH